MSVTTTDTTHDLPARLGAADAFALSRALVLAYDATKKPDGALRKPARALRDAGDVLRVAWEARVRMAISRDGGAGARRADLDEDAVWAALYHWLRGWAALPAHLHPGSEAARVVLAAVFPDGGVSFTELTYAIEWAEAERRLALLDTDGHAARIASLGGASMFAAVHAAHTEYERVLGVHASEGEGEGDGPGGAALAQMAETAREAIVAYLAAVQSVGDGAQREALAVPVRRWNVERAWRVSRVPG